MGQRHLIEAVPCQVHTVLTDNGVQFSDMPSKRVGPTARYRLLMLDRVCREHGIEHRLTSHINLVPMAKSNE